MTPAYKALNWLQARFLEGGERKVLQREFHDYLLSIGAPVVGTAEDCVARGWIEPYVYRPPWGGEETPFYRVLPAVMTVLPAAADAGPRAEPRRRSTESAVRLKTFGAIQYKIAHPDATEDECARAGQLPRTTLRQQQEWLNWLPKIEAAAGRGRLEELKGAWDKQMGKMMPVEGDLPSRPSRVAQADEGE